MSENNASQTRAPFTHAERCETVVLAACVVGYLRGGLGKGPKGFFLLNLRHYDSWTQWRRRLSELYARDVDSSWIDAALLSALKTAKNDPQALSFNGLISILTLKPSIGAESLALAYLYIEQVRDEGRTTEADEDEARLIKLAQTAGLTEIYGALCKVTAQKLADERATPVIVISGSFVPLLVDFLLRIATAFVVEVLLDSDDGAYYLFATLLLPPVGLTLAALLDRRARRLRTALLQKKQSTGVRFKVRNTGGAGMYAFLILSFLHILFYNIFIGGDTFSIAFVLFYHGVYLAVVFSLFSNGSLRSAELERKLTEKTVDFHAASPDENDETIVTLESQLTSIQQRIESYVLESALLGALAFSGFLQILSQNTINVADLSKFGTHVALLLKGLVLFQADETAQGLAKLGTPKDLFCLISALCLLCSVFFLLVIASRLRFSDAADSVRRFLTLARDYNEKEDALYQNRETLSAEDTSRLNAFSKKIAGFLHQTRAFILAAEPIAAYMRVFRALGVLTFFIVVVTSAVFIANWFVFLLGLIFLGSQAYFQRARLNAWAMTAKYYLQETTLLEYNKSLLIGAGLFSTGFIYKREMLYSGISVMLLTRVVYLWLAPQTHRTSQELVHAPDFDIAHVKQLRATYRLFAALGEALLYIALLLKFGVHAPGGNEILSIAGLLFGVLFAINIMERPWTLVRRIVTAAAGALLFFVETAHFFQITYSAQLFLVAAVCAAVAAAFSWKNLARFRGARYPLFVFLLATPLAMAAYYFDNSSIAVPICLTLGGLTCIYIAATYPNLPLKYRLLTAAAALGWFGGGVINLIDAPIAHGAGLFFVAVGAYIFLVIDLNAEQSGLVFGRGLLARYMLLITFLPAFNFDPQYKYDYFRQRLSTSRTIFDSYDAYKAYKIRSLTLVKTLDNGGLKGAYPDKILKEIDWQMKIWKKMMKSGEESAGSYAMGINICFTQPAAETFPASDTVRLKQTLEWSRESLKYVNNINHLPAIRRLFETHFYILKKLHKCSESKRFAETKLKIKWDEEMIIFLKKELQSADSCLTKQK